MATEQTCPLDELHAPKEESLKVFHDLLPEIRKSIVKLRKSYTKHDLIQGVEAAEDYDDTKLAHSVKEDSLVSVRVGRTAYGVHIFGKVKVLDGNKYILVRMFDGSEDGERMTRLHSVFTGFEGGDRQLFWNEDVPVEFFNE